MVLLGLCGSLSELRAQGHDYSVSLIGSLSTSSRLFFNPDDQDEFIRSQYLPLNNTLGAGVDVRRTIEPLSISVGLSVEYLAKTETFTHLLSQSTAIPVKDGFTAIPIELSAYFQIPVGSDILHLYMGGGAGAYLGSRQYRYAGVQAPSVDRKTGYGIHIVSGLEYSIRPAVSLRSELKFRNVQFESVNRFSQSSTLYEGSIIGLDEDPFKSRVSIAGMTMALQLVYHF